MEAFKGPGCDQSNELIAFLYGEMNGVDAQSFQRHMNDCSACKLELADFSDIRSSVVAWRDESLGKVMSPTPVPNVVIDHQRRPSALTALREFFNLSPAWLKGAVAFASLLLCLLVGLAVSRLQDNAVAPLARTESTKDSSGYTEQEIKALVDQRVKDELERLKGSANQAPASQMANNDSGSTGPRNVRRNVQVATNSPARRPLTKVERDQLAADLRLVAVNTDAELDLLDDRINQ